ncbi:MAG: recombination mediator RecR [Candidatus Syntrophopropionicum ammoniitolerans]
MNYYTKTVARLIDQFSRLPGIDPKTAQRLAFYLLVAPPEVAANLANAIAEARTTVRYCQVCGNFTEGDRCFICSDGRRSTDIICVVERPRDIVAMEKTKGFRGLYHVLHGVISPMEGVGPGQLRIKELMRRLEGAPVKEIILATNPSVEGDATALYLAGLINPLEIRVTRLAHGLPVGVDLEYADQITLSKALEGRRVIK